MNRNAYDESLRNKLKANDINWLQTGWLATAFFAAAIWIPFFTSETRTTNGWWRNSSTYLGILTIIWLFVDVLSEIQDISVKVTTLAVMTTVVTLIPSNLCGNFEGDWNYHWTGLIVILLGALAAKFIMTAICNGVKNWYQGR